MSKETLKERLKKRRKQLSERSQGGGVFFPKEGKTRFRVLPIKDEEDWAYELTHFYLGPKIKGVFSRDSIGEDCPILEYFNELKNSDNPLDKDRAKKISPRKKYLVPAILYKDERGKEIDMDRGVVLIMVSGGVYGSMIDAFLDPDLGDFTDPLEGYDFKITRTGAGKTDTVYSIQSMRPSKLNSSFRTPVDLEKLIREKALLSPEAIEGKLEEYKALEEEEREEPTSTPRRKKKRKSSGDV